MTRLYQVTVFNGTTCRRELTVWADAPDAAAIEAMGQVKGAVRAVVHGAVQSTGGQR